MEDNISKIKDRLNIVDVISDYLKLQKAGVNFKARCPFHNEKSGSFFVSPERQIWHCFGCGAGGDIFGFVKQIEGVEFTEALHILAAKAGVELSRNVGADAPRADEKEKLYKLLELAAKFYEKQLWHSSIGKLVLDYLHKRGMTDDSVKAFRLGYAPDANNALKQFLDQSGYTKKDMVSAGLIGQSESDRYYDRFRNRIMFPVADLNSRVVGFSARIFEPSVKDKEQLATLAKYVNTPQTSIYDKSRLLYGLNLAKLDLRRQDKCLVVEGNMDVIMSHQAGVGHTIASSGTALTEGQLRIIKRYTDNLDLCFDADNAGQMARDRGVELALAHGFNVGVVTIAEDGIKDAADYVQRYGAGWVEYAKSVSRPFMDFYMHNIGKVHDASSAQGKKFISAKLLPLIKILPSKIEQSHWITELALLLKLKDELLMDELGTTVAKIEMADDSSERPMPSVPVSKFSQAISALDPLEQVLISIALKFPELVQNHGPVLMTDTVSPPTLAILAAIREAPNKQFDEIVKLVEPAMAMPLEFVNLKAQELWKDFTKEELTVELTRTIDQIKRRRVIAKLTSLEYSIKEAEKNQDSETLETLVAQFNDLITQNNNLIKNGQDNH